ncbi:hypothetical protein [Ralstonia phage Reminis]|uniref:Uncharacterized protein n=1 Tax=Ralstonia phage Reminis TaxID=2662139 RepID=A0A5Q2U9M0_9CAUD|nr:hypothetical protein [Ralstonia phage Reminis]
MTYANKEEALEAAAEMALDGKLPTPDEFDAMQSVGVDYKIVYALLSEVFYDGEELEESSDA